MKLIKLLIMRYKKHPGNEIMKYCYDNERKLFFDIILLLVLTFIIQLFLNIKLKGIIDLVILIIAALNYIENFSLLSYVMSQVKYYEQQLEVLKEEERLEKQIAVLRKQCYLLLEKLSKFMKESNMVSDYILQYHKTNIEKCKDLDHMKIIHNDLTKDINAYRLNKEKHELRKLIKVNLEFIEEYCKHNNMFSLEVINFLRKANRNYYEGYDDISQLYEIRDAVLHAVEWVKEEYQKRVDEENRKRNEKNNSHNYNYNNYNYNNQYSNENRENNSNDMTLKNALLILELEPKVRDMVLIKKQWHKLMIEYHPDKHPGDKSFEEKAKKINEAYNYIREVLN